MKLFGKKSNFGENNNKKTGNINLYLMNLGVGFIIFLIKN